MFGLSPVRDAKAPEASRRRPEQEAQRSVCSQLGSPLYEPLIDIRRRTDQAARELLTQSGRWGGTLLGRRIKAVRPNLADCDTSASGFPASVSRR
ncbi:hypothetical protein GCM10025880_12140 [Methylorubrum aminovorans]|nr:hypothetical protein GCM10025880_12140 [Methylorubrum aminovorans]